MRMMFGQAHEHVVPYYICDVRRFVMDRRDRRFHFQGIRGLLASESTSPKAQKDTTRAIRVQRPQRPNLVELSHRTSWRPPHRKARIGGTFVHRNPLDPLSGRTRLVCSPHFSYKVVYDSQNDMEVLSTGCGRLGLGKASDIIGLATFCIGVNYHR